MQIDDKDRAFHDQCAIAAMNGLTSHPETLNACEEAAGNHGTSQEFIIAKSAFIQANAMVAERNKR